MTRKTVGDEERSGSLTVEANTTTPALQITQTGTGAALLVEDSTSPDSSPFVVTADGQVVIGSTSPISVVSANQGLQVASTGTNGNASIVRFTNDNGASALFIAKSRSGTLGANTVVQSGDGLGNLIWAGADGTGYVQAAQITAAVDGTPGTNDMPGRLVFSTTADGASTPTERMRITSAGNVGIGTSSPGVNLHVETAAGIENRTMLRLSNNDTRDYADSRIQFDANGQAQGAIFGQRNAGSTTGVMGFQVAAAGTLTERMRIGVNGLITGTGTSLGAWTAYTPTLGGTGWAIGNGTAAGVYCQIGKVVHFHIAIITGSTTTFGATEAATVTLPVTASNLARPNFIGRALDTSASELFTVLARCASTTVAELRYLVSGTNGKVNPLVASAPFAFATSDEIRISGTYDAA